jgi:hypothetical protein
MRLVIAAWCAQLQVVPNLYLGHFERIDTMTNPTSSDETQKPASPAPTPQQQTQGDPKPNTDKPAGQQQQK